MNSTVNQSIKRAFDLVSALAALLILAPFLVAIAAAVKWVSPGPVLYRGDRVGRNGRVFKILKFRSMVVDAERLGGSATPNDDPRLTRVGVVLRRYKLDELPQLWNVLKGDMSVVGPRPEVAKYVRMYTYEERRLLQIRPGITDWASIWDVDEGEVLAGSTDPERTYEEVIRPTKLRLQLEYLRTQSLALDLKIVAHTIIKLVNRKWTPKEIAIYGNPVQRTAFHGDR